MGEKHQTHDSRSELTHPLIPIPPCAKMRPHSHPFTFHQKRNSDMPINEATGLSQDMGVTEEMMACPLPRVPLIDPENIPEHLAAELAPLYERGVKRWGKVSRFLRLLGWAPGFVEGWQIMDGKLRVQHQKTDPESLHMAQLVIIKTAILTECNN